MSETKELAADELVTLAHAAEQLGVHYMTAYRYVRTGRMLAEKRGGKWWVTPHDLAAVIAEGTGARPRPLDGAPREMLIEPFRARLVAGDTAGCWDLVSAALAAGATPAEIHTRMLGPALDEIGSAWARGELGIADEHRATASAYRLIGQLGPLFRRRGRRRGTIILGTVSGDHHGMPTAILCDLLSDRHFDVIDLGANTPTESFLAMATDIDDLIGVGVGVVLDNLADSALAQVAELREALPDTFLLAGGPGITDARRDAFTEHVDVVSRSTDEVCDAFEYAAASHARGARA